VLPIPGSLTTNIDGANYKMIIKWITETDPVIFCVAAVGVAINEGEE
jgi:hypothetical protein